MHDDHARMMRYILAKWISRPIGLVARLGIADRLAAGPRGVEELADAVDVQADTLYRVLRALAGVGVFREHASRRFSLTPLGECLKSDGLRDQALLFDSAWHDRAWSELEHAVRTGESAFGKAFGRPAFEWLAEHPEEARIHGRAMAANLGPRTAALVETFPFGRYGRVVDVGGGHGALAAAIVAAHPGVRCLVAELPHVVEPARDAFAAAGVAERCSAEACDFLAGVPAGGDLYVVSNILHDWDDERCRTILRNCRRAMNEGAALLVVEHVVPPANEFSPAQLLDLEMLVLSEGGRERTEEEFGDLLDSAGLHLSGRTPLATGEILLEAAIGAGRGAGPSGILAP